MTRKIKRLIGTDDYTLKFAQSVIIEKINEIIDYVNSQEKVECICSNYKRGQTMPICPVCDKKEELHWKDCHCDTCIPIEEPKRDSLFYDPYTNICAACQWEKCNDKTEDDLHTCKKEEPKSTLRETLVEMLSEGKSSPDQFISLFKSHILQELPLLKVENWTVNAMPQFSAENKAHNDAIKEIEQIIKNL